MDAITLQFADKATRYETTARRLGDIAEYLGVSPAEAVGFAINLAWERLAEDEDMLVELEYKRHGRKIGGVTYLNAPEDFLQRVEARLAQGVPLPHEDDASIENDLLFLCLSQEQQDAIRAAHDPAEKRRLKAEFLRQTRPEDAADNFGSNLSPSAE